MSVLPLYSPRPTRAPSPRRHLEIAPTRAQRRARPKVLPALVTIAGIVVILLAQLLLSIAVAEGAYRIAELQGDHRDLKRQEQALTENLEVLSSTQNLIANAEHLGMIASGNPAFLDLSSGAVSGNPTPAGGSLTGASGNQIGNSLLDPTALVTLTPVADQTPIVSPKPTLGRTSPVNTAPVNTAPASNVSSSTNPESPNTIPSPNTH